jgi:hypothetical protein
MRGSSKGPLQSFGEGTQTESDLIDFIDNSIASCLRIEVTKALRQAGADGLAFDAELPQERRSLVPSDFGFHNS